MVFPWQQSAFEKLHLAWKQNRLPHALLLAGPIGMGKREFSKQLISLVLCEHPNNNGEACGHCKSCHLLQNNNHPDFVSVEAVESGQIKIEQNLKKGDSPQIQSGSNLPRRRDESKRGKCTVENLRRTARENLIAIGLSQQNATAAHDS